MNSYQGAVYREQGGNKLVVGSGGSIDLQGGTVTTNGTQASAIADLTENSGAIGGTNDGDLPDLSSPDAAANAAANRENAAKINGILAVLRSAGILPSS